MVASCSRLGGHGVTMYLASVAKTSGQLVGAIDRLTQIARTYSVPVLMSNCGGQTSIWNEQGQLTGQLDDSAEGLLILDTDGNEVVRKTLSA